MVLLDPQVVGGDAGVLSTVQWLGDVDLQCTVHMDHIRVTVFNAGLTVFEPARKRQMTCFLVFNGAYQAKRPKNTN